jgi:putative spermidine/putrescine transport system permease protein
MLANHGIVDWLGGLVGLGSPGYGIPAVIITQAYIWLPYVILPIFAGLERVPDSMLEAASDLGASGWQTIRTVVMPIALPAMIAGSIFSFSLTMGDYITVNIVGGASQMIGNLVYTNVGAANNLPLASAIALIPIVIMIGFLSAVRRTGALDSL